MFTEDKNYRQALEFISYYSHLIRLDEEKPSLIFRGNAKIVRRKFLEAAYDPVSPPRHEKEVEVVEEWVSSSWIFLKEDLCLLRNSCK